jgi:hypothetical protein
MAAFIAEIAEMYGDEILDELADKAVKSVISDTVDKFKSKPDNSEAAQKYFFNFDKATNKILDPYKDKGGLFVKDNRFAGSMKELKNNLYNNKIFIYDYNNLILRNSENKNILKLSHEEIYDIFKNNEKAKEELKKLINDHSNYKLEIRKNNLKDNEINKNKDMNITETPIQPGQPGQPGQPVQPATLEVKKEALWAPRMMLGGQDILRLTDTDKIEELKNFTLFDLVTPILTGDLDNLLAIQKDIQNKIRFYNNYNLPKPPKDLPPIMENIKLNARPMMNAEPVKYPFRLDNTGNQQSNKYYSTWADQNKTELINDYDVIKRSNLDPDVIQLVNKQEVNDNNMANISDIDMYMFNR